MELITKHMSFLELLKFAWTMDVRNESFTSLDGDETIHFNDRGFLEAENITIAEDDRFIVRANAYEFDLYKSKVGTLNVDNHPSQRKIDELERKAEAYDLLKEDLEINEKVFREQSENDDISMIIHGHYVQLLEQAKLKTNSGENSE